MIVRVRLFYFFFDDFKARNVLFFAVLLLKIIQIIGRVSFNLQMIAVDLVIKG